MLRMVATLRRPLLGLPGVVVAVLVACGGSSNNFSESEGDAGDSSTGGTNAGSGGTQGGGVASGGDAGTVSSGGSAGSDTGGSGGTMTAGGTGAGGTETGGEAGAGGSAGFATGGTGGQVGGSGGVGGMADPRCPLRPPGGVCPDDVGLTCRYNVPGMCLCTTTAPAPCVMDSRCVLMTGAPPPNGDRAIPVSTQTCTCIELWSCTFP